MYTMTLGQLKQDAVKLIDEFSSSSEITDDNDIKNKLNSLFNIAQIELSQISKINSQVSLSQDIPVNALGTEQDDLYTHNKDDITFTGYGRTYYFQVKGIATITIKQDGMEDIVIENNDNTQFATYKGILDNAGQITIVFGGEYYYSFRNIAIYDAKFSGVSTIPAYQKWLEYTLPDDFYQLNYVTYRGSKLEDYKKLGGKILIPSSYVGEVVVNYFKYPTLIDDDTPDDFELELNPEALTILPYYVASDVLKSDVSANYTAFEAKYNAKLEILNTTKNDDDNSLSIIQILGNI